MAEENSVGLLTVTVIKTQSLTIHIPIFTILMINTIIIIMLEDIIMVTIG